MAHESASDGTGIIALNPYLEPYRQQLRDRFGAYRHWKAEIERDSGSVAEFAAAYRRCGLQRLDDGRVTYREWIPHVRDVCLVGDFNGWDVNAQPLARVSDGSWWWSTVVPARDGACAIGENSAVKVSFVAQGGERVYRIPVWIRRTRQPAGQVNLDGLFTGMPAHVFRHAQPASPAAPVIYECHVGVATTDGHIGQWGEFIERLAYIRSLGYNTLQLMAVAEHPYYASFGYHVTSLFAPASRFGPPEDLQRLIDEAHGHGMVVLIDLVHAHSAMNVEDGLNMFNGTQEMYFLEGERGVHKLWNSRMFNFGQLETLRLLLSNLRYWVDVFRVDGFRFDGVTAMLYWHRGLTSGAPTLDDYFAGVDHDALAYMQLANEMLHALYPRRMLTIAEEVSGQPGLCRPVADGGGGFDYRLAMGVPDLWEETVKLPDEQWNMGHIVFVLNDQRPNERVVTYCESHDQCIVGSKTLAFWLMDKAMYTHMSALSPPSIAVDRGMALHKMIRLITLAIGGNGYLNFMGNEFAHPEWLDFPRAGNNNSSHYARRQWNLAEDKLLRYGALLEFDRAMHALQGVRRWLEHSENYVSRKHEDEKVIVFERAGLLFVFNFHPTQSYTDYRVPSLRAGKFRCVLCSDDAQFGGFARIEHATPYYSEPVACDGLPQSLLVYLPSRVALVLALDASPAASSRA